MNISKTSRTTIIITTHYIEEARKADRVIKYGLFYFDKQFHLGGSYAKWSNVS
jgi:hypothetical protein